MAEVIKEVYRENMNQQAKTAAVQAVSPFGGGFASFNRGPAGPTNLDANGNPRGVLLTVSSIDRTNTLVIGCPDWMYEEIVKHIITPMEEAAKDHMKVVQVVDIAAGVDPAAVAAGR